jgi:hypothetical protein
MTIEDGDGPLWKASYYYVPAGPNQSEKSYQMFWKQADAEAYAAEMKADPSRFSDVEVSFPHYAGEDNDKPGWIAVEDLNEEERAQLDRLLSGKGAH